jgi:peptidoglycan/LPS O-acetylase OafA/YrhL
VAFWWAFYASIAIYRGADVPRLTSAWWLIQWPALHLWYLPFLFVSSILVQICRSVLGPLRSTGKELIAVSAGLGISGALPHLALGALPSGARAWIICLPAGCLGVAMTSCLRRDRRRRLLRVAGIVTCAGVMSCYLLHTRLAAEGVGYSIGTALAALCALPVPRSRVMAKLALLTPGIYLIHPFAFMVVSRLAKGTPPFWLFVVIGTLGSGAVAWFLKRHSVTRLLV